jgi:hypothetical protein
MTVAEAAKAHVVPISVEDQLRITRLYDSGWASAEIAFVMVLHYIDVLIVLIRSGR